MDGVDGKVIFKVKLDNEIKKVIIHNDEINYNELLLMIQRIFSDRIKPNDEFRIKYADDVDGKEEKVEEIKASEIVNELRHLRTSVDSFLNKFERFLKLETASTANAHKHVINKAEDSSRQTNAVNHAAPHEVKTSHSSTVILNDIHKEFDPLVAKKGDLAVQKNSRAETPDSIGSSEFSLSQHNKQTQQSLIAGPIPVVAAASSGDVSTTTANSHFGAATGSSAADFHYHQQHQQQHIHHQQQQQLQQFSNQAATLTAQQQFNPATAGTTAQQKPQQQQQQPPQYNSIQAQPPNTNYAPVSHPQAGAGTVPLPPAPQQQQPPQYYQQPQPQQQQQQQQPQQLYQPQPQQFYNTAAAAQQQQQQPPYMPVPSQYGQPMPQAPAAVNTVGNNPYSNKTNTNVSLARPPSASMYPLQQGYK